MKKIMLITAVFLALALTGCQNVADPTEISPEEQTENTAGTTHESAPTTSGSTETEPETPVSEADGREGFKFYDLTGAEIDPAEVCSYRVEYALGWTNDAPGEYRKIKTNDSIGGLHVGEAYSEYSLFAEPSGKSCKYVCSGSGYTLYDPDDPFGGTEIEGIMSCEDGVWLMYMGRNDGDEQLPALTAENSGEFGRNTLEAGGEVLSVQPFPIYLRVFQGEEDVLSGLDPNESYRSVVRVENVSVKSFSSNPDEPADKMIAEAYVISVASSEKI